MRSPARYLFLSLVGFSLSLSFPESLPPGAASPRTALSSRLQRPGEAPAPLELRRLAEQALTAVNAKDRERLTPLVTEDALTDFRWMQQTTTKEWKAAVLAMPALEEETGDDRNSRRCFVVFTAWHSCQSDGDHIHRVERTMQGWRIGREIPETETNGFRVRDHELTLSVKPQRKSAFVSDRVQIESTGPKQIPYGILRLSSDFTVEQVRLSQPNGSAVPFRQAGGILMFVPPSEPNFTLALRYSGEVEHRGSDFIQDRVATLSSYWYPHIARLPAKATITATAPPGWTPIAPGELLKQSRDPKTEALTCTFRNEIPVCFYTVNMARFSLTTRKVGGREVAIYLLQPDAARAKRSLDMLERAMAFYERHFSPYPYSRFTLVEAGQPFEGALEGYSLATFGPNTLPDFIPHELAHTWWGGLIPCTYTRSMWNESFAEYSDGLFRRLGNTPTGRTDDLTLPMLRRLPEAARLLSHYPLSQAQDTSDDRQAAAGYIKGAFVLNVLEAELGQETMLTCVKAFLSQHRRGEAADWPDFESAVQRVTGKDYRWFFAQWMERPGLPRLRVENVTTKREGEMTVVEAEVVQDGPSYRLRLPVRLDTKEGKPVQEVVEVTEARTPVRYVVPGTPSRLRLDPRATLPLTPAVPNAEQPDPFVFEFKRDASE